MHVSPIRCCALLCLACIGLPGISAAESGARIIGLQVPAWVDRGGDSMPARPGMVLDSADRIRTGNGSRALLRLGEGSLVRLGENGVLDLERLRPPPAPDGVFDAALRVLKGAFRFTTGALATGRRSVDVSIGTVTAGIRGTDIWGKSTDDKDILCLLEGHIQVSQPGFPGLEMDEPLTFYVAPRDGAPLPVGPVPEDKLKTWVPQTELAGGQGVLSDTGAWQVNLASYETQPPARQALEQLRDAGYPAQVQEVEVHGRPWFRLSIHGFDSYGDAGHVAESFRDRYSRGLPWIMTVPERH